MTRHVSGMATYCPETDSCCSGSGHHGPACKPDTWLSQARELYLPCFIDGFSHPKLALACLASELLLTEQR